MNGASFGLAFESSSAELNCKAIPTELLQLPGYDQMMLHYWSFPRSVPRRLMDIAELSRDLSGRTLRRLPMLAIVMYITTESCNIDQALRALEKAVHEEMKVARPQPEQ